MLRTLGKGLGVPIGLRFTIKSPAVFTTGLYITSIRTPSALGWRFRCSGSIDRNFAGLCIRVIGFCETGLVLFEH